MTHARALTCLVLCAALASGPAAAQEGTLGRLFFTPEQRAALDARRRARVPDKPAATPVESPYSRVDGTVRRAGGRSTVFVNGEAIPEGATAPGGGEAPSPAGSGRVRLPSGEAAPQRDLRVGETLDRGTGEVRDVVRDGEVRVRPGNPPRPR